MLLEVSYPYRRGAAAWIFLILSQHMFIAVYGFYDECKRRCNVKIWKTFCDCFNTMPIAALIAGKIFCVHGGLR
jgi:hypothetical protein